MTSILSKTLRIMKPMKPEKVHTIIVLFFVFPYKSKKKNVYLLANHMHNLLEYYIRFEIYQAITRLDTYYTGVVIWIEPTQIHSITKCPI